MGNTKTHILSETLSKPKGTDQVSENTASSAHIQHRVKGFGVAASPFNGIKLELGFCVMLGVLLWLGANSITADEGAQLMLLLAYSLLSMVWLVVRTRALLRRFEAEHAERVGDEKK